MNQLRNGLLGFGVTIFTVGVPLILATQQLGKRAAREEKSTK